LDSYEYGMSGRVFQYDFKAGQAVDVFASFGGLLMLLQGEQRVLNNIEQDQTVYLLARKTAV
jgi:DNA-directed RNA polymerase I, II, and III subunit RPABC3